jgi:hypothetical protein
MSGSRWEACRVGFYRVGFFPELGVEAEVQVGVTWNGWPLVRMRRDAVAHLAGTGEVCWSLDGEVLLIDGLADDVLRVSPEGGWYHIPDGYTWDLV